ncbi:prolyl oligopeptidase family serine peptidase [Usitatibacter palustris]|uniref:prolyl oligopeptidase n=1 Tax=Usitatibacter palustris TaxID=2732487 RepID=A0A6M4H7E6_9PROT|nr:prolyl oligopeptidase family serine peptidase [Usitatibacter palustris]QJR15480.1 Prolyl endopeptidase [Usitatibacter palustris]
MSRFHCIAAALAFAGVAAHAQTLPVFPVKNVPETFFGTVVNDPYRALEDTKNADVLAWMKAHSENASKTLKALPGYANLFARVAELEDARDSAIGGLKRVGGGTLFFTRRGAKDNTLKLFVRKSDGAESLLVDPDDWQKETGKPHAINYFFPSHDGRHVAVGVSASGSEDASLYVIETATRKRIGEPIDRASIAGEYAGIAWNPNGKTFFFLRLQKPAPGAQEKDKYLNSELWMHTVGQPDDKGIRILGPGISPRVPVKPAEQATVVVAPGSKYAVAMVVADVEREMNLYVAPLASLGHPGTPWVKICTVADKVTNFAVKDDSIYLMTHATSPRYAIVRTSLAKPDLKTAETIVPASDQVIFDIGAAKDALYYESRDGAVKRLKRMPWGKKEATEVTFPIEGAASLMAASPNVDGAVVGLSSWTRAFEIYAVDGKGKATNTGLQPLGKFGAPTDLVATEVRVKSHDGALVPLSIIHRKDVKLDGNNPTLLYGYGAYGITEEPGFTPRRLAWLEKGGVYAVANVRGSGVYGKDWHLGGFKATKPNTWKDFIACAEYLIAQKYTSNTKLGILGGSAGGILIGRALTERPDLFAAAIPAVGTLDAVRFETEANGVLNVPEFGTVKTEEGFKALYEMSSYHHVKPGTRYPAVMLPHGVNDPRVTVWHSSKMAAQLLAATSSGKPVLLNLDFDSGHGIGDTKAQRQKQTADVYSFLFWQAGVPEFQPK